MHEKMNPANPPEDLGLHHVENLRKMHGFRNRTPGSSISWVAVALLSAASLSGCGGSSSSGGAGKASPAVLESAKESLAKPTKVRGKTLPADANLSARERRALKNEGQLPQ